VKFKRSAILEKEEVDDNASAATVSSSVEWTGFLGTFVVPPVELLVDTRLDGWMDG
jgi:hypothetical protein